MLIVFFICSPIFVKSYNYLGNHCPGGVHSYAPCGDVNPCDHVGECSSDPSLSCHMNECGNCMAVFVDEATMMPATCQGKGDHGNSIESVFNYAPQIVTKSM